MRRATVIGAMIVIGLAGPAGSGKSAAAGALAARPGVASVDLDAVAWTTYAPGTSVYRRLVERFGATILSSEGRVDRTVLGRVAFESDAARRDLESIVHPAVSARLRALAAEWRWKGTQVLLVEGALLTDSSYIDRRDFDAFIYLDAPEEVRRARLRLQGREQHVERGRNLRPGPAAHVVSGEGSREEVAARVWAVVDRYLTGKPASR